MHLFREERILGSYGFKATFPIETDILWQENKKLKNSFGVELGLIVMLCIYLMELP